MKSDDRDDIMLWITSWIAELEDSRLCNDAMGCTGRLSKSIGARSRVELCITWSHATDRKSAG